MPPLTDVQIRTAKPDSKPQKLTDGNGLYLEVRPTGTKLWRYRYRIAGKENVYALGEYPTVGLAAAREARQDARKLVKQGIHPSHARHRTKAARISENADTFEAVAKEWMEKTMPSWTPYYQRQVVSMLEANVFPHIGRLPIRTVTAAQLLQIVRVTGKRAPTVAILVRQWCSAIFRYGIATLRADNDPTAALRGSIVRPRVEHRKPLGKADVRPFMKALDNYQGLAWTATAMRLLMLTFVRPVELRAAEWKEFDLEAAEWRIPAGRMKMRESHIVPLSAQATALLKELKAAATSHWLFPNVRRPSTFMSGTTLNRALERMGYGGKFSSHGFRATASTMLNELGYNPDVIERQLAHAPRNKVRASYNRAEYLAERRKMMQGWADYLDGLAAGAAVTGINRAA